MTNRFKIMAALLALFTLASACEKLPTLTDEEMEAEDERMGQERYAVMRMLRNLADVQFDSEFDDDIDFEEMSLEPTIGEVRDPSQPLVRCILVEDASDSEERFRNLLSGDAFIRETDDGCMIDLSKLDCRADGKKQNFGTLTFHRGGDGTNAGYADVKIPCIPHLERIAYMTREQWGDNAGFDSPCKLGDIYFGKGVYWVCVREAESRDTKGTLVNVEPGYGTLHKILWDANFEPDNSCFPTIEDIKDYLRLCARDWYAGKKGKVIRKFDNKVFPRLCSNHADNKFNFTVGTGDFGFATSEADYSFYALEGIGDNKKNGACIVYDAEKRGGKKYLVTGSKKRYVHYLSVPYQCERDEGTKDEEYGSRSDKDFYKFYSNHWMYICNAVYFTTSVPKGFVKQNI